MGVLLPWFLVAGFQTYRDLKVHQRPPVPSEFVASGGLFAAVALVGQANEQVATVLAWGLVLALYFKTQPQQALAPVKGTPAGSGQKK